MTITLTPAQQRWLESEVAAGRFPSVEAAVRLAVDHLMPGDLDDLTWVGPYLDEARTGVAHGEVVSIGQAREHLGERIRRLRGV
jgi:Arc/MetJ-type ribon-helix-helix transcriptional regulator